MKIIDESYDNILKVDYTLFNFKLSELKILAETWYEGVDIKAFDNRIVREGVSAQINLSEMKKSGLVSNLFVAYVDENNHHYLLDGYNRLFTDYGVVEDTRHKGVSDYADEILKIIER